MKKYIIYTKEIVVGQTTIIAHDQYEARRLLLQEIEVDKFQPDMAVTERVKIHQVKELV